MQRTGGLYLGSIFGTTIRLDISFLMIMALFVMLDMSRPNARIEMALLWIPVLFVSVLVHELAHAAMIAMLGFGASEISLSGLGGHTYKERKAQPWQNLLISIAGPLSSFGLAIVFTLLPALIPFFRTDPMMVPLSQLMVMANVLWGIFNFLPIFPLDGGSVLYNFIAMFAAARTAFITTTWASIAMAAGVLVLSLILRQFFIAIIAAMLLFQNWQRWNLWKEQSRMDQ